LAMAIIDYEKTITSNNLMVWNETYWASDSGTTSNLFPVRAGTYAFKVQDLMYGLGVDKTAIFQITMAGVASSSANEPDDDMAATGTPLIYGMEYTDSIGFKGVIKYSTYNSAFDDWSDNYIFTPTEDGELKVTFLVNDFNAGYPYQNGYLDLWIADIPNGYVSKRLTNDLIMANGTYYCDPFAVKAGTQYKIIVSKGTSGWAAYSLDTDFTSTSQPVAQTWYSDFDGDGYGDSSAQPFTSATTQSGYVSDNTDCDDTDAKIYPGATEIAGDNIDQDCDGSDLAASTSNGTSGTACSVTQWQVTLGTGQTGQNTDGTYLMGATYRGNHKMNSVDTFDLMSKKAYIKWKANSLTAYGSFWVGAAEQGAGFFTTHHSWNNSTVIESEKWYYTSLEFKSDNTYTASTCTDAYCDSGGTSFYSTSGAMSQDSIASVSNASIYAGFNDVYETNPFITIGEAKSSCDGTDSTGNPSNTTTDQIYIVSPLNNEALSFGNTNGALTFGFTKVSNAAKYLLHLQLKDLLAGTTVPLQIELIPPCSGSGTTGGSFPWSTGGSTGSSCTPTPGFTEVLTGMQYLIQLDAASWDSMSSWDITWGVEAYDSSNLLIGSTFDQQAAAKFVNGLKFIASTAIALTSPSPGSTLLLTDSAPVFKWDTYIGVKSFELILAHVSGVSFDSVIPFSGLTLNLLTMDTATWQSMPTGKWYWTVLGYDSMGNPMPSKFTIFDFEVQ